MQKRIFQNIIYLFYLLTFIMILIGSLNLKQAFISKNTTNGIESYLKSSDLFIGYSIISMSCFIIAVILLTCAINIHLKLQE